MAGIATTLAVLAAILLSALVKNWRERRANRKIQELQDELQAEKTAHTAHQVYAENAANSIRPVKPAVLDWMRREAEKADKP